MKNQLLFVLFFTSICIVKAMPKDSMQVHLLSDVQAVEFALTHFADIKNAKIDVQIQEAKNREYIGMALPQLKASVNATRFLNIPVSFFPDVFSEPVSRVLNGYGVKDGNGNVIPVTPADPNAGNFVKFGQNWNTSMGLSLSQILFEPNVFISLIATKEMLKMANAAKLITEEKVTENVLKLYYNVLLLQKKKYIMEQNVERMKQLVHETQRAYENGFREKLDFDRIKVAYANLLTVREQISTTTHLLELNFKYVLGMNVKDSLSLTSNLDEQSAQINADNAVNFSYQSRKDFTQLAIAKTLREIDVKRNKLLFLPIIVGSFDYNYNSISNDFLKLYGKQNAFPTSYVNVNISLPLFKGNSQRQRLRQAQLELLKTNTTIESVKNAIEADVEGSKRSYSNALQNVDLQKENSALAKEVYSITKKKFNEGLSQSFELIDAHNQLNTAESNYYDALAQLMQAKISLQKSLGQLGIPTAP